MSVFAARRAAGGCPIRSDVPTMLSHLRNCPHQPEDVKSWASAEHAKHKRTTSHSVTVPTTPMSSTAHLFTVPMTLTGHSFTAPSSPMSSNPHQFMVPTISMPSTSHPFTVPTPMSFTGHSFAAPSTSHMFTTQPAPIPHASSSHQPIQNLPPLSIPQNPFNPQPGFMPQLSPLEVNNAGLGSVVGTPVPQSPYLNALGFSAQPSPSITSGHSLSRPTSSLSSHTHGPTSRPLSRSFSPYFDQHDFNMQIGKMTVAADLPLGWTDNPVVRSGFSTFLPLAQLPSRKTLSRSILPTLQSNLRTQAQKEARGSNCTLQCDGWTGINSHHLIAFMITVWPKVCTNKFDPRSLSHCLSRSILFGFMMHMVKVKLLISFWSTYSL